MKAIVQQDLSDNRSLVWSETDDPQLKSGEVMVQIHAAGVNRGDLLQARGFYPPPAGASEIIGLEAAGVVSQLGPGTEDSGWSVGDRVGCLLAGGGYAQSVAVPAGHLLPVPDNMSLTEMAGTVEVAATVWSNLGMVAGLRERIQRASQGKSEPPLVLIHGGAGGIGSFAIQLVKAFGGRVATTAGSAEKLQWCRELGADLTINYREEDFVEAVSSLGGADIILDVMGAKYLPSNVKALAADGHLVVIGLQGGVKGELNLNQLLTKRASVSATSLRGRDEADKARVVTSTVDNVLPLLADGAVRSFVTRTFPMSEAAQAHEYLDSGENKGKIVLVNPDSGTHES